MSRMRTAFAGNIGADYPQVPTGTTFTSVSGEWTVPAATQHTKGQAEDSASWIGIGGGCVTDMQLQRLHVGHRVRYS
jgi:hypothetical protein